MNIDRDTINIIIIIIIQIIVIIIMIASPGMPSHHVSYRIISYPTLPHTLRREMSKSSLAREIH